MAHTTKIEEGVTDELIFLGMESATSSLSADGENLGFWMAFSESNDSGGIHGRKIEPNWYPRHMDQINLQVDNAKRLIEKDNVLALVNFGGPGAIEIADLAENLQIPYLFPHTALISSKNRRYIFTSFPQYSGEAKLMFQYLVRDRGLKKLAIAYAANTYGRQFLSYLMENKNLNGLEFSGAVEIDKYDPSDLTEELKSLVDNGAEVVIMALHPKQAQALMQAKADLNWTSGHMVTTGPLTDERYLDLPNRAADGTIGFCHFPDPASSSEPGFVKYRKAMAKYNPTCPFDRYSLYGYVYGQLIVKGIREAGQNLTRERLVDALENLGSWDAQGPIPPVTLTKINHHAQSSGFICELKDGRFEDLSGWIKAE
jgi:branched-chain amino acid transport system substrate-binding protein